MLKKNILKTIQEKEMDRKDFLKFGAMAAVSLVGLRGIVSLLSDDKPIQAPKSQEPQKGGYGGSAYGA